MSAYGPILKTTSSSTRVLAPTLWNIKSSSRPKLEPENKSATGTIALFHLTLGTAPEELVDYLCTEFLAELERGRTYPQESEGFGPKEFRGYFFAGDVLVGLLVDDSNPEASITVKDEEDGKEVDGSTSVLLDNVRAGREWKDCVAGFYYVKPNYPGRSSHICNGGFVVPYAFRGRGFARVLARSFLHYAPRLGFSASVFNLVFADNVASLRLWEALGFEKIGRIPKAGRLRKKDGDGEEYVDAWVIYKQFDPIGPTLVDI